MTDNLICSTEIGWFNPSKNPPPFDMKLLVMVAGNRSDDGGFTWEPYTQVLTATVKQTGPSDEYDDVTTIDEYLAGDRKDFMNFQFDLEDADGNNIEDWWTDSIIAWAYYPLAAAQIAVELEKQRQATL